MCWSVRVAASPSKWTTRSLKRCATWRATPTANRFGAGERLSAPPRLPCGRPACERSGPPGRRRRCRGSPAPPSAVAAAAAKVGATAQQQFNDAFIRQAQQTPAPEVVIMSQVEACEAVDFNERLRAWIVECEVSLKVFAEQPQTPAS